jgi:hypothetical protein
MRAACLAFAGMLAAVPAGAEPATWIAVSKTAMAITGDIVPDDYSVKFANGKILDLEPYEADRVGDWSGSGSPAKGFVYKIDPPSDPKLLNGNRLCGEAVTFVVTFMPHDGELALNVYAAKQPPTSLDGVCAYSYEAD